METSSEIPAAKRRMLPRCGEEGKLSACGAGGEERAEILCVPVQIQKIKRALCHGGKRKQHKNKHPVLRDEGIFRVCAVDLFHQRGIAASRRDLRKNSTQTIDKFHQLLDIFAELQLRIGIEEHHLLLSGIYRRKSVEGIKKGSILRRYVRDAHRIAALCNSNIPLFPAITTALGKHRHTERQRERKRHHNEQQQMLPPRPGEGSAQV